MTGDQGPLRKPFFKTRKSGIIQGRLVALILSGCSLLSVLTTIAIVLSLVSQAFSFFAEISFLEFITGTHWSIIPMVSSLSEDAMIAVPRSLKNAAYALGATRMEVSLKVVVPAALSGIVASFILAISRAIGETMLVTIAAGQRPSIVPNPLESIQAMTAFIANTSLGEAARGSIEYNSIFAVGILLFCMTLSMNLLGFYVVRKWRQQY